MSYKNVDPELLKQWTDVAKKLLVGKKIIEVRYLNDKEMETLGWYKRPLAFILDDNTFCFLSSDDEGNDGGVLMSDKEGVDEIPTL